MPCNIGYQETFKARVPEPERARGKAPAVDADLLERLGVEDPSFVEWLDELDTGPLLRAALDRTSGAVDTRGLSLALGEDGSLEVEGLQRARLDAVIARWQLEVLGVVAELLGYETRVTDSGVVGQRPTEGGIEEHFTVTREGPGGLRLRFEHFKSPSALRAEMRKIIALARLLGLAIDVDLGPPPGTREREAGEQGRGDDPLQERQ